MVNNLDWTAPLSAIDFLRDIGKHFRVGTMMSKDAVAARLNSDAGISYTEFSYQILQGMDYLQLYRHYGCVLQTGGSDQWGNLTSGTELIRKVEGVRVHALGTPLITNAMARSSARARATPSGSTPSVQPLRFYQFWLNTDDTDVVRGSRCSPSSARRDRGARRPVEREPFRREAQSALAHEVTALVHGAMPRPR